MGPPGHGPLLQRPPAVGPRAFSHLPGADAHSGTRAGPDQGHPVPAVAVPAHLPVGRVHEALRGTAAGGSHALQPAWPGPSALGLAGRTDNGLRPVPRQFAAEPGQSPWHVHGGPHGPLGALTARRLSLRPNLGWPWASNARGRPSVFNKPKLLPHTSKVVLPHTSKVCYTFLDMVVLNLVNSIKKFFKIGEKPDCKAHTRHMIKKYGKTLRKLSYE